MEDPTTSQHIHLHFVNWQQQQEILEQNVFWVKVVLAEFIKGDWIAQIRSVGLIRCLCFYTKEDEIMTCYMYLSLGVKYALSS